MTKHNAYLQHAFNKLTTQLSSVEAKIGEED